jgi:hypothetical protein
MKAKSAIYLFLISTLFILFACTLSGIGGPSNEALQLTQIALGVQSTQLALQQQQATLNASGAVSGIATYTPQPTYTSGPPPITEPIATDPPTPVPTKDIQSMIRGANVLIYEDIWGDSNWSGNRRVSMAVQQMGFSGGRVINLGDALGDFKGQLNSGTPWDLIVVSAESRADVRGEFWDYMIDQVHNGVALVAEVWYLDKINLGRISPLMTECGISLQKNWSRPVKYDLLDYSITLLDPTHPVFNTPNAGVSLSVPNSYWPEDAGDLLRLGTGGDAKLLAGVYKSHPSDYGLIAECFKGRVIFQTFSTHDYRQDQTVPLWVNYMTYTLTKHFEAKP